MVEAKIKSLTLADLYCIGTGIMPEAFVISHNLSILKVLFRPENWNCLPKEVVEVGPLAFSNPL